MGSAARHAGGRGQQVLDFYCNFFLFFFCSVLFVSLSFLSCLFSGEFTLWGKLRATIYRREASFSLKLVCAETVRRLPAEVWSVNICSLDNTATVRGSAMSTGRLKYVCAARAGSV